VCACVCFLLPSRHRARARADIRTVEVLLRSYEASHDPALPFQLSSFNYDMNADVYRTGPAKGKGKGKRGREATDADADADAGAEAEGPVAPAEPASAPQAAAGPPSAAPATSAASPPAAVPAAARKRNEGVVYSRPHRGACRGRCSAALEPLTERPRAEMRGHTGYLTFSYRACVDQPAPAKPAAE
jgi:hypothetical protein